MQVPAGAYTDAFGDALADDASDDAPGDELADPDAHGARHQDPRFMIQANFLKQYLEKESCILFSNGIRNYSNFTLC